MPVYIEEMKTLFEKLNYRGHERIALLNADDEFINRVSDELNNVKIDREIDPRYPYGFIMVFVKSKADVETYTPVTLHNLLCDGILWFCYPKKTSKKYRTDVDRDHGWKTLENAGFHGIRMVAIDNNWSALRFRSIKFIRSTSDRFTRK